ncbi:MAG: hypothetical protein F6K16_37830 [Symploca sp. SIO2B6]|nr:hypothetical protein [Symploca sp. SIO2B6]
MSYCHPSFMFNGYRFRQVALGGMIAWLASLAVGIPTQAFVSSGLFHPRSSEQFFEDGLERFEDNIDCLVERDRCWRVPAEQLNIDESVRQQYEYYDDSFLETEQWRQDDLSAPNTFPGTSVGDD